jgi:hypothetical protein
MRRRVVRRFLSRVNLDTITRRKNDGFHVGESRSQFSIGALQPLGRKREAFSNGKVRRLMITVNDLEEHRRCSRLAADRFRGRMVESLTHRRLKHVNTPIRDVIIRFYRGIRSISSVKLPGSFAEEFVGMTVQFSCSCQKRRWEWCVWISSD